MPYDKVVHRMERDKKEQDARKDRAKKSLSGYKKRVTGPSRAAIAPKKRKLRQSVIVMEAGPKKKSWVASLKSRVRKAMLSKTDSDNRQLRKSLSQAEIDKLKGKRKK